MITIEMIPYIEKALGFKLHEWQKLFLFDEHKYIPEGRAVGYTTIYIVRLLLKEGKPIDIKQDARKYQDHEGIIYTDWFSGYMKEIDYKLTSVGLETRSVNQKKQSKPLSISVDVDTNKMQLKLRAIAKHTEALADELDAIDNAWQCDCGSTEYTDDELKESDTNKVYAARRVCRKCCKAYKMPDDSLPTNLEGSE